MTVFCLKLVNPVKMDEILVCKKVMDEPKKCGYLFTPGWRKLRLQVSIAVSHGMVEAYATAECSGFWGSGSSQPCVLKQVT